MKTLIGSAVLAGTLLFVLLLWWLASYHLLLFNRLFVTALFVGLGLLIFKITKRRR